MHGEQFIRIVARIVEWVGQGHSLHIAAAFEPTALPGMINQNPSHRFRSGPEEVPSVLPPVWLGTDQSQVGFVNEGGRLECMLDGLMTHSGTCQPAQLLVHEGKQLSSSGRIPVRNSLEDERNRLNRRWDYGGHDVTRVGIARPSREISAWSSRA